MLGSKTTLAVVRELSWGILGRGEVGLKGIGVSGSGYNEVLALGMLNVVDYVERGRCAKLPESASAPHPVVVALLFQACLHACMRTCVRACVHPHARVCGRVCIHMRRRACVRVHAYARAPVYAYVRTRMHAHTCACVCLYGGSWWRRLGVSDGVLGARTHLCACACMYTRICMGAYVHSNCFWQAL